MAPNQIFPKGHPNFRVGYTWEARLVKPSFREEFRRLAHMFIEQYGEESEDGILATSMLERLLDYDNHKP